MIKHNFEIRSKTYDGTGALYVAAFNGDFKIVDALCAAGADPNATNDEGLFVLFLIYFILFYFICFVLFNFYSFFVIRLDCITCGVCRRTL
jgi:ankyrin repeat protein